MEKSRTFRTRDEADRFARKVEVTKDEGSYIDPSLGKTLFLDWAQDWLVSSSAGLKPNTISGYRSLLRKHIIPAFGNAPLVKVRAVDIRQFIGALSDDGMSPSRVRSVYFLLQAIFRAAVESGYIGRSPCLGVKLPRPVVREMSFLSAKEVKRIVSAYTMDNAGSLHLF